MRVISVRLTAVLALGALFLLADSAAAGITFTSKDGIAVSIGRAMLAQHREDYAHRRDEYYARRMKNWMQSHRREPTAEDLSKSSYLRKLWDAYRRVKARDAREKRERERDRERYREWKRRKLERRAKREYQKALDLFSRKRYRDATAKFGSILKKDGYAAYHEDAKTKLDEMNQIGQDEIGQAQQLAATQDYEKAMGRYLGVMRRFRGLPCAGEAAKALKALRNSPEVQAKIKKERAARILKRAEAAYAKKRYTAAASSYEVLVKAYADLDEGRAARSKLDEMKADEAIWPTVVKERADAAATSLLALAKSYLAIGKSDKAVPRLKELIRTYPDSEQAKTAKALMATTPTTQPAP